MKIPKIPNRVSKEDEARLAPHLSGINALNEILVLDTISTDDLMLMLAIEKKRDVPRFQIGHKLIARVVSRIRVELKEDFKHGK